MNYNKPMLQLLFAQIFTLLCVTVSYGQPLQLLRNAAVQNDTTAQLKLAEFYALGLEGLSVNQDSAYHYLELATQNNSAEGAYLLALHLLRFYSKTDSRNFTNAYNWLMKAGAQGHVTSLETLMDWHLKPVSNFSESNFILDSAKAAEFALKAVIKKSEKAGLYLTEYFLNLNEDTLAIKYLTITALRGNPQAQLQLADHYRLGTTSLGFNPRQSIEWYTQTLNNPRSDFEQRALAEVGTSSVYNIQIRILNLLNTQLFIDPRSTPLFNNQQ